MNTVVIPYSNETVFQKSGKRHIVSDEVSAWITEHQQGEKQVGWPPFCYHIEVTNTYGVPQGSRFVFKDSEVALMFKLAWAGL